MMKVLRGVRGGQRADRLTRVVECVSGRVCEWVSTGLREDRGVATHTPLRRFIVYSLYFGVPRMGTGG